MKVHTVGTLAFTQDSPPGEDPQRIVSHLTHSRVFYYNSFGSYDPRHDHSTAPPLISPTLPVRRTAAATSAGAAARHCRGHSRKRPEPADSLPAFVSQLIATLTG